MAQGAKPKSCSTNALLRLPGEIRNHILRYVLVQEDPIHILDLKWTKDRSGYLPVIKRRPAISLTCNVIRHEALSIYYGENRFIFGAELHLMSMHEIPEQLSRWAQILGSHAQHLRVVDLAVNCEMLGPKNGAALYRDFWEVLQLRVARHGTGTIHCEMRGDPTFSCLCVCELDQFMKSRYDQPDRLLAAMLEASRSFFKTTELGECEECGRQQLRDVSDISPGGLIYL